MVEKDVGVLNVKAFVLQRRGRGGGGGLGGDEGRRRLAVVLGGGRQEPPLQVLLAVVVVLLLGGLALQLRRLSRRLLGGLLVDGGLVLAEALGERVVLDLQLGDVVVLK